MHAEKHELEASSLRSEEPLLQQTGEVWSRDAESPCELDAQTLIVSNFVAASPREPWIEQNQQADLAVCYCYCIDLDWLIPMPMD